MKTLNFFLAMLMLVALLSCHSEKNPEPFVEGEFKTWTQTPPMGWNSWDSLPVAEGEAILTVLQGEPTDEKARPESRILTLGEPFKYKLPAYSLSVIRMKSK